MAPRPLGPPSHRLCRSLGLATRLPIPLRSPAAEWQLRTRCEVGLTCSGVTDEDVQRNRRTWRRASLGLRGRRNTVNVFRDGFDVVLRYGHRRHGRHARVVKPIADDRKDRFAGLIVEDECRSQQVRAAALAAPKVRAVTGAAVRPVEVFPRAARAVWIGRCCAGKFVGLPRGAWICLTPGTAGTAPPGRRLRAGPARNHGRHTQQEQAYACQRLSPSHSSPLQSWL